jgi:hypothetical protein
MAISETVPALRGRGADRGGPIVAVELAPIDAAGVLHAATCPEPHQKWGTAPGGREGSDWQPLVAARLARRQKPLCVKALLPR